jgi:ATP-dependent DNA helicase RecG
LVEESEKLELQAAQETYEALSATFPELRVGLVHGRMPARDKAQVMQAFKDGQIHLLVATTVIEVGVDVPNASLMVIEHAERMGLAQLHQLRGRVGRGAEQSYCLLVSRPRDQLSEGAVERLEAMTQTTDGFELAERDLEIRGEGELLGARQSGLSDLRFSRLRADRDLLERAREVAGTLDGEGLLADAVDRLLGESEHVGES